MSHKVSKELSEHRLEQAREDLEDADKTLLQIETAKELIKLVEEYMNK